MRRKIQGRSVLERFAGLEKRAHSLLSLRLLREENEGFTLKGEHIVQGMHKLEGTRVSVEESVHPIELFAKAYGL